MLCSFWTTSLVTATLGNLSGVFTTLNALHKQRRTRTMHLQRWMYQCDASGAFLFIWCAGGIRVVKISRNQHGAWVIPHHKLKGTKMKKKKCFHCDTVFHMWLQGKGLVEQWLGKGEKMFQGAPKVVQCYLQKAPTSARNTGWSGSVANNCDFNVSAILSPFLKKMTY